MSLDLVKQELPAIQAIIALNARPGTDVATIALQELQFLEQIAMTLPAVHECEPLSVVMAVKSAMKWNLTLDPQAGLIYVKTRSVKINNQWRKVLDISRSANGLISFNRQIGRILDYTNPAVVKSAQGKVIGGSMEILKPSYPQPRWEKYEYDESDIRRWMAYSHKENARNWKPESGKPEPNATTLNHANALYTSFNGGIDPEFMRAKICRRSMGRLGGNQNEAGAIKVYNVPHERLVDPGIDMLAAEDGEYTPVEEMPGDEAPPPAHVNPPSNIPNSDDL
jgi:hypothetical protein